LLQKTSRPVVCGCKLKQGKENIQGTSLIKIKDKKFCLLLLVNSRNKYPRLKFQEGSNPHKIVSFITSKFGPTSYQTKCFQTQISLLSVFFWSILFCPNYKGHTQTAEPSASQGGLNIDSLRFFCCMAKSTWTLVLWPKKWSNFSYIFFRLSSKERGWSKCGKCAMNWLLLLKACPINNYLLYICSFSLRF